MKIELRCPLLIAKHFQTLPIKAVNDITEIFADI